MQTLYWIGHHFEFVIFAGMVLGIILAHHHTRRIALSGMVAIIAYKALFVSDFHLFHHLWEEKKSIVNLFLLLAGFDALADHFRRSRVGELLPRWLPDDWKGGFTLLVAIFLGSTILDNIAAALIGGSIAITVFRRRVHLSYVVAIVAASNAGGAGSVIGDTTSTMVWLHGVPALVVAMAFLPSVIAFVLFAVLASVIQDRHQRIMKDPEPALDEPDESLAQLAYRPDIASVTANGGVSAIVVDRWRLAVVGLMLVGAVLANVLCGFPALGVWIGLLLGSFVRKPDWHKVKHAAGNAIFLLALVLSASMMPVRELPVASPFSTFILGVVSAVFDNIPLTALALRQGGYDWGLLAYAVGFGGSMMWFGSSAGVAIATEFEESPDLVKVKDAGRWLHHPADPAQKFA